MTNKLDPGKAYSIIYDAIATHLRRHGGVWRHLEKHQAWWHGGMIMANIVRGNSNGKNKGVGGTWDDAEGLLEQKDDSFDTWSTWGVTWVPKGLLVDWIRQNTCELPLLDRGSCIAVVLWG